MFDRSPTHHHRDSGSCPIRAAGETGQAAVSFVAVVPLILIAGVLLAQAAVVGYSAWSAAGAARAGARAVLVGGKPEAAVDRALPGALARRAEVSVVEAEREVAVEIRAPRLLPLFPAVAVSAATAMRIGGGSDG